MKQMHHCPCLPKNDTYFLFPVTNYTQWVWGQMKWSEVAQSCPTLCDSMHCSLQGSSVHGIFQARVLELIAIFFSRGSSPPREIWGQIGSKITADGDRSHEIKRCLLLGRKVMTNLESILKSRHYFANKGPSSQGYGFSHGQVWMWELDCEESWEPKNWCFWTVVLEKTLESPLDCREIQPVHPKGDRSECSSEGLMLKLKL